MADRHHAHDHAHGSELSEMQLRVRALETILTEKGYIDPAALDQIVENVETRIGPHIGAQFGVDLPAETRVRVWASTAETRFFVRPMRPERTESWSEEQLAALVTRDSMVGTGLAKSPEETRAEPAR